jgi:AraC-like DNA-binding protein
MDAESAIRCFERLHQAAVTIHDPFGSFVRRVPTERFRHQHSLCKTVKKSGQEAACVDFDGPRLRATCLAQPQGFAKRCHGGLLEVVVPQIEHGSIRWILFAGAWSDETVSVHQSAPQVRLAMHAAPALPALAEDLLEALRWLSHRLAQEAPAALATSPSRTEQLHAFLRGHHGEDIGLPEVAQALGLSTSRASHAIRELTGEPFSRLLAHTRLEAAELLLQHTDLSILQVALRAGYGDLSHFHSVFRRKNRTSPGVWRKRHASV